MITIDDYRIIDEKFGNHVMEHLIRGLSEFLKELCESDVVSTVMRDEGGFLALVDDELERVLSDMIERVREEKFETGGVPIKITISAGGYVTSDYLLTRGEFLKKVRELNLEASKLGGNNYVIMDENQVDRK
jgi:GGDEF domain-containing protein